jgi:4-amino-4-deoxychorismate lyase
VLNEPLIIGHEELSRDQLLLDRGFQYGDGLFETIAAHHGVMPMLQCHLERLQRDALVLLGDYPAALIESRLKAISEVLSAHPEPHVVKLLVTRGVSGRGYGFDEHAPLRAFAFIFPYTPPSNEKRANGLNVINCRHLLADKGLIGSIKHCNRLDQVIARAEVQQHNADEGLMFNHQGQLIEATSANVAIKLNGQWLTPDVSFYGIAGVARQLMLEKGLLTQANISQASLVEASALVLINSVQGIMPVHRLAGLSYSEKSHNILDELGRDLPRHMVGQW